MSWKTPEEYGISAELGKMNRIRINRKGSRASRGKSSMNKGMWLPRNWRAVGWEQSVCTGSSEHFTLLMIHFNSTQQIFISDLCVLDAG